MSQNDKELIKMTKKRPAVSPAVVSKNATPKSEKRKKIEKTPTPKSEKRQRVEKKTPMTPKTPNREGNQKSGDKKIVVFKDGGVDEKSLDKAEIEAAVEAIKKLNKDKSDGNESLFNDLCNEAKINLQITAIKLPKDERQQLIRM